MKTVKVKDKCTDITEYYEVCDKDGLGISEFVGEQMAIDYALQNGGYTVNLLGVNKSDSIVYANTVWTRGQNV